VLGVRCWVLGFRKQHGSSVLESALLIPILVLLFVGAMEIGKITLTYYQLHKALRAGARMAALLAGYAVQPMIAT